MILGSNLFIRQKAALFIAFDEGNGDHQYPSDNVYAVWAGSVAKSSFSSSNPYSHYSFLKTIEANWHLPPLTSNDQSATPMLEFFIHPDHDHLGHEHEMKDHEKSDENPRTEFSGDSQHDARRN